MPVASSSHSVGHTQADGRRYVKETHLLTVGDPVTAEYLAPASATDADFIVTRDARALIINESLATSEYKRCLDSDTLTTTHLTATQLAARFRAEYLDASRSRACQMAYWLLRRIAAGDFTDTQCRNAFGLTVTQWNNLKTSRLQPQHDAWVAVLAATGA